MRIGAHRLVCLLRRPSELREGDLPRRSYEIRGGDWLWRPSESRGANQFPPSDPLSLMRSYPFTIKVKTQYIIKQSIIKNTHFSC